MASHLHINTREPGALPPLAKRGRICVRTVDEFAQAQRALPVPPAPWSAGTPRTQTQSELPAPGDLLAEMWRLGRRLRQFQAGTRARAFAHHVPVSEMPKKATGKGKSQDPAPPPPRGPVAVDPKGCVTIAIHAKPGARLNAVADLTAEAVSVAIAAPPTEGEANAELCRFLSKVLGLRKSDVVLEKGGKSREKVVKLLASTTPEEVLEKLKKHVEKE